MVARFSPDPGSVVAARKFVASCLTDWGSDEQAEVVMLLTSEAVTNAVVHGGPHEPSSRIGVEVFSDDRAARIEVSDAGAGQPQLRVGDPQSTSGRGLFLIDALAQEWGVIRSESRKVVWFEVSAAA